jgi:hypothetical protein
MRRNRTIYFNDARHFYLFVFEPPMTLKDAWRPVDEVEGTGVDTLVYGIARGDGLFFPTKVGKPFYSDVDEFENAIYWKVRQNIVSLQERGLDILQVLADRAHERGMEFFTSFRMGTYEGVGSPSADPSEGGRGLAEADARENQFRVFEEIVTQYNLEGLELDFGASPGGMPQVLLDEDVAEYTPIITEHVRRISEMTRAAGKQVGVRVPCVEKVCETQGFDIRTWLKEGLVDYVVPTMYANLRLDTQMPIEWLIESAHAADISVHGMLQPFVEVGYPGQRYDEHFSPEMMRAATSNYLTKGTDGVYTWFLDWPLGANERNMLTEMANPDLMTEANKQYRLPRREETSAGFGYDATLPLEIPGPDAGTKYSIPIYIADDIEGRADRIRKVTLRIRINNTVSADEFTILLNGESLAGVPWRRDSGAYVRIPVSPHRIEHYSALWLQINLDTVRPKQGDNLIEISLDSRPPKLGKGVTIDDLEINIEYSPWKVG